MSSVERLWDNIFNYALIQDFQKTYSFYTEVSSRTLKMRFSFLLDVSKSQYPWRCFFSLHCSSSSLFGHTFTQNGLQYILWVSRSQTPTFLYCFTLNFTYFFLINIFSWCFLNFCLRKNAPFIASFWRTLRCYLRSLLYLRGNCLAFTPKIVIS